MTNFFAIVQEIGLILLVFAALHLVILPTLGKGRWMYSSYFGIKEKVVGKVIANQSVFKNTEIDITVNFHALQLVKEQQSKMDARTDEYFKTLNATLT